MKRTTIFLLILLFKIPSVAQTSPSNISPAGIRLLREIASVRNEVTQVRMRTFPHITLANENKAAGIIESLLNRAEERIWNVLPPGKFNWSWSGLGTPSEIIAQAKGFLKTLSAGKDPFEGKFAEPGGYVVDHALVERDSMTHLFYIRGAAATNWPEYPESNLGHAISKDLINWQVKNPVLQCPDTGWDDYQIWSPYVLEHNGEYFMFYTGVNKKYCEAIGLATSRDLYHWKRYGKNPVVTTGRWGIWNANEWSDCRDPMVLQDDGVFYCYYCAARIDPATGKHEYCVGISSSKDLYRWKDRGFIRLKQSLQTPPESPFVVKHGRTYYLFYTNYKYGISYAISQNPLKHWRELPTDEMSLIPGSSASEIYHAHGKWYISFISHMRDDLHFLEIRRLIWNKGGTLSVRRMN